MPVLLGGLGLGNLSRKASEYASSVKVTSPLVEHIVLQTHQLQDETLVKSLQQAIKSQRAAELKNASDKIRETGPPKIKRVLDLTAEKGSSVWLTEMGFYLNKREFRDAIKLRYDWSVDDTPSTCACEDIFTVDHTMICKCGGFVIQRHNELRDIEAEFLSTVFSNVEIEPVLQDNCGEQLNRGANKAQDARLDIHVRGFWEHQQLAFFDVRVCHPNATTNISSARE